MTRARIRGWAPRTAIGATCLLVTMTSTVRAQVPPDIPEPVVARPLPADETPVPEQHLSRPVPDAPPLDLSDRAIQKAIADSKSLMDGSGSASRSRFGSGSGKRAASGQERIDRRFRDADVPTCLTTDAFKFNPPVIGPFTFSGFAALPFWAQAIGSGGCRF